MHHVQHAAPHAAANPSTRQIVPTVSSLPRRGWNIALVSALMAAPVVFLTNIHNDTTTSR
jgi:hypothetical protein